MRRPVHRVRRKPNYPAGLRAIESPPPLIAARGYLPALQKSMAAIVGSRNASAAGLAMAERLARGLGAAGFVVVSGLARGIDAQAHRAALTSGTIGVSPAALTGLIRRNILRLLEQMLERGRGFGNAVRLGASRPRLSPPQPACFGAGAGTIVVEAARRSGSLITARFAREQNRELFAVPGSPLDPRAEGPNDLLREGAHVCASDQDVIEVHRRRSCGAARCNTTCCLRPGGLRAANRFGMNARRRTPTIRMRRPRPRATSDALLARLLGPSPVAVDDLARVSGRSARTSATPWSNWSCKGVWRDMAAIWCRWSRHGHNAAARRTD